MAGRTEARIAALLSLLAATLIIAHNLLLHPTRASAFTDRPLSALRFDGRHLLELINRRNMILLCNAILLLILRDAGLIAAPAGRRGTTAGGEDACCEARPKPKSIVEASRSSTAVAAGASDVNSATVADAGRVQQRERPRGPEPDESTPPLRRVKPSSERAAQEYPLAREIDDPAEKQSSKRCCFNDFDHAASLRPEPVDDDERSRGKEMARHETEAECVDDVDEMNKKFEEFIASMRNMQLESLQLVKV